MNDFKSRINRFMLGRRGIDEFEKFIGIAVLVFLALYIWLHSALCYYIVIIGIVYGLFRMFSTNIPKRYRENEKYLEIKNSFIKPKKKQNDSPAHGTDPVRWDGFRHKQGSTGTVCIPKQ